MPKNTFAGRASPIDGDGIDAAVGQLQSTAADLWAVVGVETTGCGFLEDRRPKILFERHVFSARTSGRFDAAHPDISNPVAGGYGPAGAAQYDRLARAIALDRRAALESASWGLGQVMGYNAPKAGFAKAADMVKAMRDSENAQIVAMARFIADAGLDAALRAHDWARFARGYNGPNYRINNYDTRLAVAHDALARGGLPDVVVRAAQMYLTYLGFDPHGVDGVMGRLTRSALNDYQRHSGLPVTDFVDPDTFERLRDDASAGT
jgi:hypothetical protein